MSFFKELGAGALGVAGAVAKIFSGAATGIAIGAPFGPVGSAVAGIGLGLYGAVSGIIGAVNAVNHADDNFTPKSVANSFINIGQDVISTAGAMQGKDVGKLNSLLNSLKSGSTMSQARIASGLSHGMAGAFDIGVQRQLTKAISQRTGSALSPMQKAMYGSPLMRAIAYSHGGNKRTPFGRTYRNLLNGQNYSQAISLFAPQMPADQPAEDTLKDQGITRHEYESNRHATVRANDDDKYRYGDTSGGGRYVVY